MIQDLNVSILTVFAIANSTERRNFMGNFTFMMCMFMLPFARQSRPSGNHNGCAFPWWIQKSVRPL